MITRSQAIIIAMWVGLPFVLFLVLYLINPAYERKLFEPMGPVYGISLLTALEVLHGLILYEGYRRWNQRAAIVNGERRLPSKGPILLLFIVTLFFCSLPSLWLVLLYPSAVLLLQSGCQGCIP
jgi:hypothetical protein